MQIKKTNNLRRMRKQQGILAGGVLLAVSTFTAQAGTVEIFHEDFENAYVNYQGGDPCTNCWGDRGNVVKNGVVQENQRLFSRYVTNGGDPNTTYAPNTKDGIVNWNIHDGSQNPWASGGTQSQPSYKNNPDMAGWSQSDDNQGVLGHRKPTYKPDEQSYYEIDLDLTGKTNGMVGFDYDSWISADDKDGFNVVAFLTGDNPRLDPEDTTGFVLLNPMDNGDPTKLSMTYDVDGGTPDYSSLDNISGSNEGFNGWGTDMAMAGAALFSLAQFDGQMVTIRMSFGGNSYEEYEGINIDNVWAKADMDMPSGGSIPEPTSLALFGLGFLGLRAAKKRS